MSKIKVWTNRILIVMIAPVIINLSRITRNIILSRSLSPDEFGAATAISVVVGLVELVTDVALDRYVVIRGTPLSLSAAHMVSVSRGILLGLALALSGSVSASVFGIPKFATSFVIAGVVPFIMGFSHLWIKQVQRDYNYVPETVAQLIANLTAIVALSAAVSLFRDHRAIVVGLIFEAAAYVAASHALAPVRYSMRCDLATLLAAIRFGLPLTLNGFGLATISQLDRVLVGSRLGVTILGVYAVISSLSVTPAMLILNAAGKLVVPFLLHRDPSAEMRSEQYRIIVALFSILGVMYALFMALTLDWLTSYIFGPAFAINTTIRALMVIIVYFRIQRSGAPTQLLLVAGRTGELALLNISAGVGLVVAFALVTGWPRFEALLVGILVGELVSSALFFFASTGRVVGLGRTGLVDWVGGLVAVQSIVAALVYFPDLTWHARGAVLGIGVLAIGAQGAFEYYRNPRLRSLVLDATSRLLKKSPVSH